MTEEIIVTAVGSLISIALIYVVGSIYFKSHKLRGNDIFNLVMLTNKSLMYDIEYYSINKKRLDTIYKAHSIQQFVYQAKLIEHFEHLTKENLHPTDKELKKIKILFTKELYYKIDNQHDLVDFYGTGFSFENEKLSRLEDTIKHIKIGKKITSNLKKKSETEFIHSSADLYFNILKVVVYIMYSSKNKNIMDFKFNEQTFILDKYKYKLKEGNEGIESILIE